MADKKQRGGNREQHKEAGRKGGEVTAEKHGPQFYSEIGKKGGQESSGKFKKDDERTKKAAKKGGEH